MIKQDIFDAMDYLQSKQPAHMEEGEITSVKEGVAFVRIGGSSHPIQAYYNKRSVDAPVVGDFAVLVRVNRTAAWRILATYGSPTLGTVVSSTTSLQLAPPYNFKILQLERFAVLQWDAPPQQLITYELQISYKSDHSDAQTFALVGGSNYFWNDTAEAWFRCRSVNTKFQGSSWTTWLHYTGTSAGLITEYIRFTQGEDTILQGADTASLLTFTLPNRYAGAGEFLTSDGAGNLEWDTAIPAGGILTVTDENGSPIGDVDTMVFWNGGVAIAGSTATISPKLVVAKPSGGFPAIDASELVFEESTVAQPSTNVAVITPKSRLTVRDVDSTVSMSEVYTLIFPDGALAPGGTGVMSVLALVNVSDDDGSPIYTVKGIRFMTGTLALEDEWIKYTPPTGNTVIVSEYDNDPSAVATELKFKYADITIVDGLATIIPTLSRERYVIDQVVQVQSDERLVFHDFISITSSGTIDLLDNAVLYIGD